jgi:hypothetical protein
MAGNFLHFATVAALFCFSFNLKADESITITVDAAQQLGSFKQLHGINKGPLAPGGLMNVIEAQTALRIPWTRLHDCHWPTPDVVDMHVLFPNSMADPALEASYDFKRTDRYLAAVKQTGAGIVFRLGESIEHEPEKLHVHPPADPARWAEACIGIIKHYNEGWANGPHLAIPYWEIWNEPENRPAMWTGNDAQFFELYRIASRRIKTQFPHLKVGGPSIGGTGEVRAGKWIPSEFLKQFLRICQSDSLPLDFFSWHCYTNDPAELVIRAKGVRALLDEMGFQKSESHLNEWNYLPNNSWTGLGRDGTPAERTAAYEAMSGAPGAAFIAASLMQLQDAPVDVANLFHGECGGFGLFNENGVPTANYQALLAFSQLSALPTRIGCTTSSIVDCTAAAGLNADKSSLTILLSCHGLGQRTIQCELKNLPWPATAKTQPISPAMPASEAAFNGHNLQLKVNGPTVIVVRFQQQP